MEKEKTLNLFFLFAERLNNKLFLTVFCEEDLKVDILLFSNDDKLFGFISLVKRFNSSENKNLVPLWPLFNLRNILGL